MLPRAIDYTPAHYNITWLCLCQYEEDMRLVIQRVREARVTVNDSAAGSIRTGLLVFLGVSRTDTAEDADYLTGKLLGLRIFPDEDGKMNRNVQEAGGSLLIVSQFTLYGDCRKGRRPSFDLAAPPEQAQRLYNYFVDSAKRGPCRWKPVFFRPRCRFTL